MKTIAIGINYCGSRYHGWQFQSESLPTVQAFIEAALSIIANEPIQVTCAGRTDTGVHATKQVAHFQTSARRATKAWVLGCNAHLPDDISIDWAVEVDKDFSARHSATARRYMYLIYQNPVRNGLFGDNFTRERRRLDPTEMHKAGQALLGENDFSSFRAASCQSRTAMRNVHHLRVEASGDLVVVDIQANAFLHHMVRNIVGVLLDIGAGDFSSAWVGELLALKDRTRASKTAPPDGLYLVDVIYPNTPQIPKGPHLPGILNGLISS